MTYDFSQIREQYTLDKRSETFNVIVYGPMGTGKTQLLTTARRPILIHSFDPGGTVTIRDLLKDPKSSMYADVRFESDQAKRPTAWSLWERTMDELDRANAFGELGTFAIDSATTWTTSLMNEILRRANRANGVPQLQDYMVQQQTVMDELRRFASLPCDCILTGHIEMTRDEPTGKLFNTILLTGKLSTKVPLLFDEVYCAQTELDRDGNRVFRLLTSPDGIYTARTRLGSNGRLSTYEEPNILEILRKVGVHSKID